MKNIQLVHLAKYNDSEQYRLIEEGIYIDLKDTDETHYRIALYFEQEEGEDDQYSLENLLDEFNLYVSADFPESNNQVRLELGGTLEGVQKMKRILEKYVLNKITHEPHNAVLPEYKKFSEIQHLLPAESWARWRNEKHHGEFNNEICLYISGDWETKNLDLDQVNDRFNDRYGDKVFLILVTGNMKAQNIYCQETDGATGIVVLGNMDAENMIVGGQEIYVCGNLAVKDCFWGDYNHGELIVNGTIEIKVFISTDYGYNFERFDEKDRVFLEYFFSDEDEEGNYEFPRWRISGIFKEYCLVAEFEIVDDIDGWGDWLYKYKMIEYLRAGKSILRENIQIIQIQEPAVAEIPFAFESKAFNNANLLRLRESPLFLDHYLPDAKKRFQKIEYWKGDDFKRVVVTKEELFSEIVYFEQEDRALLMEYVEVKPNIFKKLLGNTPKYQISISCRTIKEDDHDDNWEVYNSLLQEHKKYLPLTQDFWENLLFEWSEMEYYYLQFQKTVTVERIKHILSLPVVKAKYSDYYNEDSEALWFRSLNWQFRLIDNEEKQCERITIIHDLSTEEDDDDEYDFYHYDLKKLDNGAMAAVLYTQDEDGYECRSYKVAVSDSLKFKNAAKYFELLESKIESINNEYLEELQNRIEVADSNTVSDFLTETLILMTLPSEYKNFIEKYNEANFTPFKFEIQGGKIKSIVMKFFTLKGDNEILLFNKIKEFTTSGILPQSLIPIAIDPIKNLILLAVTGENIGKVYYWAIDEEDYEDTLTPRHLHLVADRFNDFIDLAKEKTLKIDITDEGLKINSKLFVFPIDLMELKLILGEPEYLKNNSKDGSDMYITWHEAGVFAYSKNGEAIDTLALLSLKKNNFKMDHLPLQVFNQSFKINGEACEKFALQGKEKSGSWIEKQIGDNFLFIDLNSKTNQVDEVHIYKFQEPIKVPIEDPDKYEYKSIEGEKIEFADFNFKLAIIQILMYEKEVLFPKFNIHEFAERYKERTIDIEKEGYDFIPEVTAYFEKLEIDKKFASEITEIYQDVNDEIYMNMFWFWDGEDDVFNIQSFKDAEHFPKLKTMTLFYDTPIKLREYLKSKGIKIKDV